MKVTWIRSMGGGIGFRRPSTFLSFGIRDSGKSSLLEHIGENYLANGFPIIDLFGCYDDQTELFTKEGFKFFKDVVKKDLVASRSSEGFLEYYHPTAIQAYPYKGKMVQIGKLESSYNLLVTPDHNLYIQRIENKPFFLKPSDIQEYIKTHTSHHTPFKIPKTVVWVGKDIETIKLPMPEKRENTQKYINLYEEVKKLYKKPELRQRNKDGKFNKEKLSQEEISKRLGVSEPTINAWINGRKNPNKLYKYKEKIIKIDDFLIFLGWYLTEGCIGRHNKQDKGYKILICNNPSETEEILTVIKNIGFIPYANRDGRVSFISGQLAQLLIPLGLANEKYIPNWVKQLPAKRLRLLIETMLKGDGSRNLVYYTVSKQLYDDFIEVAIKAGYSVTTYQRPPKNSLMTDGRIIHGNYIQYSITVSSRNNPSINRESVKEIDYDGMIYDVTLPPYHTLLVRRRGKIVWCGNSRDGEGLGWCRSPWAKDKNILLLHGDNTRVASSFDSMNISKWQLSDLEKYDITISSSPLYSSPDQEYRDVNRIIDLTYQRRVFNVNSQVTYILIREASNLLYSRMKVSTDQIQAKSKMTYFIREARHTGFALGIDTLKFTSIDIDIRSVIDYIFFKSLGIQGLPDDLNWLYSIIKPFALQSQEKKRFVCINSAGSVGIGSFPEIPWHKKEGEDILKACGIEVEHSEELIEAVNHKQSGDLDHITFIERRITGESFEAIGGEQWSRETVRRNCAEHNRDIEKFSECQRCKRAKGISSTIPVVIGGHRRGGR